MIEINNIAKNINRNVEADSHRWNGFATHSPALDWVCNPVHMFISLFKFGMNVRTGLQIPSCGWVRMGKYLTQTQDFVAQSRRRWNGFATHSTRSFPKPSSPPQNLNLRIQISRRPFPKFRPLHITLNHRIIVNVIHLLQQKFFALNNFWLIIFFPKPVTIFSFK